MSKQLTQLFGESAGDVFALAGSTLTEGAGDNPVDSEYVTPEAIEAIANLQFESLDAATIRGVLEAFSGKKIPSGSSMMGKVRDTIGLLRLSLAEAEAAEAAGVEGDDDAGDASEGLDDDGLEALLREGEDGDDGDGDDDIAGVIEALDEFIGELDDDAVSDLALAVAEGFDPFDVDLDEGFVDAFVLALGESEGGDLSEKRIARAMRSGRMIMQKRTSAMKRLKGKLRRMKKGLMRLVDRRLLRKKAGGDMSKGEVRTKIRQGGGGRAEIRNAARAKLVNAGVDEAIGSGGYEAGSLAAQIVGESAGLDESRVAALSSLRESLVDYVVALDGDDDTVRAIAEVYGRMSVSAGQTDAEFNEAILPAVRMTERLAGALLERSLMQQYQAAGKASGNLDDYSDMPVNKMTGVELGNGKDGLNQDARKTNTGEPFTTNRARLGGKSFSDICRSMSEGVLAAGGMVAAFDVMRESLSEQGIDLDDVPGGWFSEAYMHITSGVDVDAGEDAEGGSGNV